MSRRYKGTPRSDMWIQQASTMAQKLTRTKEGKEYQHYTGMDWEHAKEFAIILALEKEGYFEDFKEEIKLIKEVYKQYQKAHFGVSMDTFTKLGLALGDRSITRTGKRRDRKDGVTVSPTED
jgi:hypothetical protein